MSFGEGAFAHNPFAPNSADGIGVFGGTVQLPAFHLELTAVPPPFQVGASLDLVPFQILFQATDNPIAIGTILEFNPLQLTLELKSFAVVAGGDAHLPALPLYLQEINSPVNISAEVQLPAMQLIIRLPAPGPTGGGIVVPIGLELITQLVSPVIVNDAYLALPSLQLQLQLVSPAVVAYQELFPSVQEIGLEEFPLEMFYDSLLDCSLQEVDNQAYGSVLQTAAGPGQSAFMEVNRSASTVVIFGSEPHETFKLNPAAATYRRGGPTHVIQLARTKPDFVTVDGLFEFLSPISELAVEEFTYQPLGGFLKIWNSDIIQASLVPDGDTAAISVQVRLAAEVFLQSAASSIAAKRQY